MKEYNPNELLSSQLTKVGQKAEKVFLSGEEKKQVFLDYEGITNVPSYDDYKKVGVIFEPLSVAGLIVNITLQATQRTHILGFLERGKHNFIITDESGKDLTNGKVVNPENIEEFFHNLHSSRCKSAPTPAIRM